MIFSYLPNVKVRVSSFRRNNVEPFVAAKNIFRRVKIRDKVQDSILGFERILSVTTNALIKWQMSCMVTQN